MTPVDDPRADRPARLATLTGALPLGRTLVIGTVGAPGARRALVRAADGRVRTVANGDMLQGGRIVGVDEGGIDLLRAGRRERMALVAAEEMSVSGRPRPDPRPVAGLDGGRRMRTPAWPG